MKEDKKYLKTFSTNFSCFCNESSWSGIAIKFKSCAMHEEEKTCRYRGYINITERFKKKLYIIRSQSTLNQSDFIVQEYFQQELNCR